MRQATASDNSPTPRTLVGISLLVGAAWTLGLLGGCSTPTSRQAHPSPKITTPIGTAPPAASSDRMNTISQAPNAKDYRQDAARHLYALQKERIYKGRMPPMLHAVGVLNVDIDRHGQIQALKWMRAPNHAPEVMAEIEGMIKAAAPFPAPLKLGKVTYTDVWLWHQSGRFQLDTLTEGQD